MCSSILYLVKYQYEKSISISVPMSFKKNYNIDKETLEATETASKSRGRLIR